MNARDWNGHVPAEDSPRTRATCIARGCPDERAAAFEWCEEHLARILAEWAEQIARAIETGEVSA